MKPNSQAVPMACNMNVFTPSERESHIRGIHELFQTVGQIHEVEQGYEFIFPSGVATLVKVAKFISKERLCCPFLEFTLKLVPNYETASLLLSGPEGTQEFLREEFSEAFQ